MFTKLRTSKSTKVVVLLAGLFAFGCHFTQQTLPADAGGACAPAGTQALTVPEFTSWFVDNAVVLNGAVNPANSVTFTGVVNCGFYKWSEQMFLWLTSPATGSYGRTGLVMNTPEFYDVSLPDENEEREFLPHTVGMVRAFNLRTAQKGILDLPVFREKKSLRLLEIIPAVLAPSGKQLIMDRNGVEVEIGSVRIENNKQPVLVDITGKDILGPRAMIQSLKNGKGDSTRLPFIAKMKKLENFDRTSLVQKIVFGKTVVFVDLAGSFHETEQGQADGSVLMAQNGSLVYYSLSVNKVYMLYRTMQGTTVPSGTKFPTTQTNLDAINAFAVTSGKSPIVDDIALAVEIKCSWVKAAGLPDSDKFIKMKAVVPTYDKTDPTDWVPNGTETVELAMVGMHVVGSTLGHPELLWATFEHVSNDPAAAYSYKTTTGAAVTIPQSTTGNWVFCSNGSVGPFNESRMFMDGDHIKPTSLHTIGPSDILRSMPWGLNGTSATGNSEVISINNLARSLLDVNDLRRNYIQTGTTWTIFGASPTSTNQVGTNILANTTMETFTQGNNCFNCHSTNTTLVSHIFDATKPLF
jgi:hypothetical protein